MGNWWADKLGATPAAPAPREFGQQLPQAVHHYAERIGAPVADPLPAQQQLPIDNYEPPEPGDPYAHRKNIWKWRGNLQGGAKETAVLGNCPACGSARYFSRQCPETAKTTQNGTFYPAPECFECGYPRQQGTLSTSTITAGATVARQAEAQAPPGSLASLRR
jgi:hypothetical protein